MSRTELHKAIVEKLDKSDRAVVLSIDGPAGAGKTTLASWISEQFPLAQTVHMDDLYRGWELSLGPSLTRELLSIFEQLAESGSAFYSKFDWKRNELGETLEIASPKLLILEGVGSGQMAISEFVDIKIWIEIEPAIGLERVLARDGDSIAEHMELFIEEQERHFTSEQTAERSDFLIPGN